MKRYKLLKDLPGVKAGYVMVEGTYTCSVNHLNDDWFEEVEEPESQEGSKECSSCGSWTRHHTPDCRREGDCKHETVVAWCGDCENVISSGEKEQLKPSEWIRNRSIDLYKLSKGRDAIQMSWGSSDKQATLDFLDSVAEGKYKL